MHVRPEELRAVRRGDLAIRYAPFGDVTFALVTLPSWGSRGTPLEDPCVEPHWGFVLHGSMALDRGGKRRRLSAGTAFYVEGGEPAHRFVTRRRATIAGFVPVDPLAAERRLRERDAYEPVSGAGAPPQMAGITVESVAGARRARARDGEIETDAGLMGPLLFTLASFGSTTGFTSGWCDLPHWGLLLRGGLTIEWEDDIEALGEGDVYCCPGGPPGHRFEVADGAVVFDFTPLAAIAPDCRVEAWRPVPLDGGIRSRARSGRA